MFACAKWDWRYATFAKQIFIAIMFLDNLDRIAVACAEVSRPLRVRGAFCFAIVDPPSLARERSSRLPAELLSL